MVVAVVAVPYARLVQAWFVYQELHFPVLAPKTCAEYRAHVERALRDFPDPITLEAVLRWHRQTLASYSPSYRNAFLHTLRTVTRKAAYVTGDTELAQLVWHVQPAREPELPPRTPPRDLVVHALHLCQSPAERSFVRLAAFAGLRRGEILGLRPGDWEASTRVLRVLRQRKSPERKNRRQHSVRLDYPTMIVDLEWTIAHPDEVRSRRGYFRGASDGYLFPWSLRKAENLLERFRVKLGSTYLPPRWGWHTFRHWGACELARLGKSVWEIQNWLGDADAAMASWYVSLYRGQPSSVGDLVSLVDKVGVAEVGQR